MEKFKSKEDYQEKCHQLYSILKHSCAVGQALPKVNAFKKMKDRYSAWQKLCEHYYAKGNVQSYTKINLHKLVNLKLEPNSFGGAENT